MFPHTGLSVSKERFEELAGKRNKQGRPVIRLVEDAPMNPPVVEDTEEKVEAKPKPKRGRRKNDD